MSDNYISKSNKLDKPYQEEYQKFAIFLLDSGCNQSEIDEVIEDTFYIYEQAQKDGIDPKEVLGNDFETACNEIISNLKKTSFSDFIKSLLYIYFTIFIVTLWIDFLRGGLIFIDPIRLIFPLILFTLFFIGSKTMASLYKLNIGKIIFNFILLIFMVIALFLTSTNEQLHAFMRIKLFDVPKNALIIVTIVYFIFRKYLKNKKS